MPKLKILIVEDDPASRKLLVDYLSVKGFEVFQAGEGKKGVESALDNKPDLILMDILLPDINGLEAVKQVKSKPETKSIPVIAVTALAMKEDQKECLSAGCIDYITKPVNIVELGNKISNLLGGEKES